jgi:hypothetical protein
MLKMTILFTFTDEVCKKHDFSMEFTGRDLADIFEQALEFARSNDLCHGWSLDRVLKLNMVDSRN